MVERVSINPAEAQALAEANRTRSPGGSARGEMSVTVNPGFKGRVGHDGAVTTTGAQITSTPTETVLPDGLVSINGMTVEKSTAIARGWIAEDASGNVVAKDEDFKSALVEQHENEIAQYDATESESEAEMVESFNRVYDAMSADLGRAGVVALGNAVAAGDPEALAAVPAVIKDGYENQAQKWADDLGIYNVSGYSSALLDADQQERLVKAIISNDEFTAKALLERGKAALHDLSTDPDTAAELTRNGYSLEGTGPEAVVTFPNGAQMSLFQAFKDGHFTT